MSDSITFHSNPYFGYKATMLPDVYILLSPQEDEVFSSSWGNRCTHLSVLLALHYQLDTFKNGLAHILISLLLLVAETIKSKILANFQICICVPLKWFYSQLFWKLWIWFDLIMENFFFALQKWPWLLEINFKL